MADDASARALAHQAAFLSELPFSPRASREKSLGTLSSLDKFDDFDQDTDEKQHTIADRNSTHSIEERRYPSPPVEIIASSTSSGSGSGLPPKASGGIPEIPELRRAFKEELMKDYPEKMRTEAWVKTAKVIKKHSDEMVDQWNKEIDGLLTFAGLFSAILTAFNVQSYQLLQPSSADQTLAVMLQVSAQLASFAVNPAFVNSSQPAYDAALTAVSAFKAPVKAVLLNVFWFTGLVFSLASATLGIIVKQWLKEFSTGLYGSSREIARRRQYRLQKLEQWRVPFIVSMLPLLLQIALVLFLVGLFILLSTIHRAVTIVVATFASVLLALILLAAVIPAFANDCCYYSPQSYAVFRVVDWVKKLLYYFAHAHLIVWDRFCDLLGVYSERLSGKSLGRRLSFLRPATWRGGEHVAAAQGSAALDGDIVLKAYTITLDASYFKAAESCLVDIGSRELADKYIHLAHDTLNKHWDHMRDMWPQDTLRFFQGLVICAMRIGLAFPLESQDEWLEWEQVRAWVARDMMRLLRPAPAPGSTARWPPFVGAVLSVPERDLRAAVIHTMSLTSLATYDYPLHQVQDQEALEALRSCLLTQQVRLPPMEEPATRIVLAMVYDLAEAQDRLLDTLLYRGCFDPSRPAYGENLHDYLHAVQLSILFVARHISNPPHTPEEKPSHLWHVPGACKDRITKTLRACLRKTLTSFAQLLTSPLWPVLCRPHLWTLEYDDTIEVIARLADYDHSRRLITRSLIEALEAGLLPFQLEEDRVGGIDGYLLYLYRARCKSQLERLKRLMVPEEDGIGMGMGMMTAVLTDSEVQESSEDNSEDDSEDHEYVYEDEEDEEDDGHDDELSEDEDEVADDDAGSGDERSERSRASRK